MSEQQKDQYYFKVNDLLTEAKIKIDLELYCDLLEEIQNMLKERLNKAEKELDEQD